jgi:hypothetical protein
MRLPLAAGAIALALLLGGCATLPQVIKTIGTVQTVESYANAAWSKAGVTLFSVEATYGVIGKAVANFEAAECPRASSHSWCQTLHDKAAAGDAKVRAAFAKGEKFIADNPTLSPGALISAAESAVNDVAALADSYGVKL